METKGIPDSTQMLEMLQALTQPNGNQPDNSVNPKKPQSADSDEAAQVGFGALMQQAAQIQGQTLPLAQALAPVPNGGVASEAATAALTKQNSVTTPGAENELLQRLQQAIQAQTAAKTGQVSARSTDGSNSGGSSSGGSAQGPDFANKFALTKDSRSPMMDGGVKPWSKDWVFEGGANENPALKPLLQKSMVEELVDARKEMLAAAAIQGASGTPQLGQQPGTSHVPAVNSESLPGLDGLLQTLALFQGQMQAGAQTTAQDPTRADSVAGAPATTGAVKSTGSRVSKANLANAGNVNIQAPANTQNAMAQVPLSGDGASLALLAAQLEAMGSDSEETEPAIKSSTKSTGKVQTSPGVQQRISGSQFLDTLNDVRANQSVNSRVSAPQAPSAIEQNLIKPDFKATPVGQDLNDSLKKRADVDNVIPLGTTVLSGQGQPSAAPAPREIVGHVVPGAMAQDRLSHESLFNIGSEVRNLSAQGGGEMRIRLRPDNLGELRVQITTHGNDVSVRFMAADERARKVIEESVGHLRESLGSQNLNLAKIDFVTSATAEGSGFGNSNQGAGSQGQNSQNSQNSNSPWNQNWMGQQSESGGQGRSGKSWDREDSDSNELNRRRAIAAGALGTRSFVAGSDTSRLDVMA